ncbi:hypothetical protein [Methanothrix soehngenii]|uniref:hypothetical protein n=1 Tax=Methanothrix soehngenii TaxID=2223 RepID=UPI00300CC047
MQEAFMNSVDLHRLDVPRISGTPFEEVTDSQRQAAKAMNFLLIDGRIGEELTVAHPLRLWRIHLPG